MNEPKTQDDTRTLSPEMDEWKKRQLAKQIPDIGKLSDEQTANLSAEHGDI